MRIVLDRDEDMQITGQRHAFYAKYKVPGRLRTPYAVCSQIVMLRQIPRRVRT